ncbi:SAM-dependent methyltransferase [Nocardiopsis valliformis]|uniref:SAM-dependent methyltransferase n=1 Tax=Nocardiopsis valliformis TaxID=239974 RepID=UPI00034DDECD|nr:SAM-dependent methyltransferase [Nocardiopsis valliformis]
MSVSDAYFDAMYAGSSDPWGFRSRWYERRKRSLTLAGLPRERYARAFEPGCAIGVLTRGLADRCDELLAWEGAPEAAARARADLADLLHVEVAQARVPGRWPRGAFDLVVLSELLYYFDDRDLDTLLERSLDSLGAGGTLVAVHWRHPVDDHVRSGDDVHRVIAARAARGGLDRTVHHEERDFLLQVYEAAGDGRPRSVAEREGLV